PVKDHEAVLAAGGDAGVLEHLDVLGGHGRVLDRHHVGVLQHGAQQAHGQGGAGQLGDVVDDELGVGRRGAHGVPVAGNGVFRQVEVDGGDGGDGVHAAGFGMGGQLHRVGGVVAGHM